MQTDLTILLPLKGRHQFTLRFLWHANRLRLPYTFLIADADPHPEIEKEIHKKKFPNIKIRYFIYPPDDNFSCFYSKMDSAIKQVETSYVMLADNDDFLLKSGIEKAIKFLTDNPDYIGCGGAVMGFDLAVPYSKSNSATGKLRLIKSQYNSRYNDYDFLLENPIERVQKGYGKSSLYYLVSRKEAITKIFTDIRKINMSYLPLYEAFFYMRLLSIGKVRIDHSFSNYIRQYGTSFNSGGVNKHRSLVYSNFSSDLALVGSTMAEALGPLNKKMSMEVQNTIRDLYALKLESILKRDHKSGSTFHWLRPILILKFFLKSLWLKMPWMIFIEKHKSINYLKTYGSNSDYISVFSDELKEIDFTLSSDELKRYINDLDL